MDNTIINKYNPMIISIAKSLTKDFVDDLISVGRVALLKTVSKFDKAKKTKLSTYLYMKIKSAMKDELRTLSFFKRNNKKYSIYYLEEIAEDSIFIDVESLIMSREKSSNLLELINDLPIREKEILILIYWNGMTKEEVARYLGVSNARITMLVNDALNKLKINLN